MPVENSRRRRTTVTSELLRIIRNQIDGGMLNAEVSRLNFISLNCARTLCNKISAGLSDDEIIKPKGRKKKSHSEVNILIETIARDDNTLTQRGIAEVLKEYGIDKQQSFISRRLKNIGVTRKRISRIPEDRNSQRITNMRAIYCSDVSVIPLDRLVFLDETGFNLHTSQTYGYSKVGTKAYTTVKSNRGINQSLMCAISIDGIIGSEIISGAYNGDKFKCFIQSYLVPYFSRNPNSLLIMDNCKFHHRQDVLRAFNEFRIPYKFLPAYSPQLNPIEEFFSALKANYRAIRPRPSTILEVKTAVESVISAHNTSFIRIYEHMRRYFEMGLAKQPFI